MLWPESRREEWNQFIAGSPRGDVLQCWEWGELKSRTGWKPLPVAVERNGRLAATCLVLKRSIPGLGKCLFYAPRGPILDAGDAEVAVEMGAKLRELARQHSAMALQVDPAIEARDAAGCSLLASVGFRPIEGHKSAFGSTQPQYVMKVDITPPEDELLASFASKWRYNIRLARRKGVTVRQASGLDDIDVFYDLLLVTANRDGFVVRARSYFHDMWKIVVEGGLAKVFLAYVGDEAVGAAIAFALGSQCWYVYGASSNNHRNKMPNHLLQWEMMLWAKQQGCTVYDMRGVAREVEGQAQDEHLAGLNRFKRGFNARYVEYVGNWHRVFSPLLYGLFRAIEPTAARLRRRKARSHRLPSVEQ